jgi:hypothetical protein
MAGSGGGCREKDQPKGRHLAWQPTSTQETGGRAQAYGAVRRGIRAIGRKLDCLKPSLKKVQRAPAGKTPVTGAGPCREVSRYSR